MSCVGIDKRQLELRSTKQEDDRCKFCVLVVAGNGGPLLGTGHPTVSGPGMLPYYGT